MDRHLEPAPEPTDEELADFDDARPVQRSAWWRWVAVIVVVALVVATPFVYVLSRVLG